eukprot:1772943-Pyramimonas_sp.AAC.1
MSTDYGVDMHETLSRIFEAMGVSDHLDICNSASGGIGFRVPQLIGRNWDDWGAEQQRNNRKIPLAEGQAAVGGAHAAFAVRQELRGMGSRELER